MSGKNINFDNKKKKKWNFIKPQKQPILTALILIKKQNTLTKNVLNTSIQFMQKPFNFCNT